ncbi:TRAP transporter substrate-binding protein [Bacillus sp. FJAT-45350]|uniref:TRAP transporter substrate-binding protein n=1 Tax=Bacillus sp. FJAT-45350 TaxID=2011014 RepID=UPI000BB8A64D|nr:hypothetical protein [Bacillus sp. FJAT-45350]
MKKFYKLTLSALLLSIFLVACGNGGDSNNSEGDSGANTNSEETIVLKAATNLPTRHFSMQNVILPFLERIEEESNGRVEFQLYDSESLVRAGEELEALRSGTIDIAVPMYDVYDTARFPFSEIPLLPLTKSSPEIYSEAVSIFIQNDEPYSDGKTHMERVYGDQGLVAWPYAPGRSYTIGTVGEPIRSLSELQSLQVRVPSSVHETFARKLGASPARISINETYDAFNRGTLDAGFTPITDWTSYGFEEVFTYVIEGIEAGSWPSSFAMTKDRFESLPEDIQEIISLAAIEVPNLRHNPEFKQVQDDLEASILDDFFANGGVLEELSDLPQEIQNKVDEAVGETWLEWIESLERDGEPATEAAIRWRDAVLQAGGDVPDVVKELTVD